jgi:hypothetical protein
VALPAVLALTNQLTIDGKTFGSSTSSIGENMQVTAEMRWFWPYTDHLEVLNWFNSEEVHEFAPGGGQNRIDSYLFDSRQLELGIKNRGGKHGIEIKGLVSHTFGVCDAEPFSGPIELWSKWTSETLRLDSTKTVTTMKRRWLRRFDTTGDSPEAILLDEKELPVKVNYLPAQGCSIELTEVRFLDSKSLDVIPDTRGWWTLSLESWGKIDSLTKSLFQVAHLMTERNPPLIDTKFSASYPRFLSLQAPQIASTVSHHS